MIAVDTNVLIRLYAHDDEAQRQQALSLFGKHKIFIAKTVLLESFWILTQVYKIAVRHVINDFSDLLAETSIVFEDAGQIAQALDYCHTHKLEFADALHLASSQNTQGLATFDKNFIRLAEDLQPMTGLPKKFIAA